MADDLGFQPKVQDDDLGFQPKQKSSGLLSALTSAIPGMSPAANILAMNPKTIPAAAATLLKSIPNAAGQVVSGINTGLGSPIPDFLSSTLKNIPTPSQRASNALALAANTTLAAPGIEALPKLIEGSGSQLIKKLADLSGFNADKKANDFVEGLLGNNKFSNSHLPVLDELRNNYNNAKTISNNQYSNILNEAAQQKYTGSQQFPGISAATDEKAILPNNFQDEVKNIDLDSYPKDIQKILTPFSEKINNPLSFEDAHNLQSQLGKEGAKLRTSSDGMQRQLGGELLGLRGTLKNDIIDSLNSQGNSDLANQYKDASNFFLNNVAPYLENSTIRNVVTKKGLQEINPANIGNVLKKDDGSILPIVNQLSPQSKNLLLANQLKSASQELPEGGELTRETNAEKLIKNFGQLDNKGFADLRSPDSVAAIQSIRNDLMKQENVRRLRNALAVAGIGGGLLAGGHQVYEEF